MSLRDSYEQILSEVECQRLYKCSVEELNEQIVWMTHVINVVYENTGQQITEEIVAIIVKEFGDRVRKLGDNVD